MGKQAFTPGPWKRSTDLGIISTSAARINKNGRAIRQRVALLDYKGLDQVTIDANAALIGAAPELYEALDEAMDLVPRVSEDDPMAPALAEWCAKVRAALAKAVQS